VKEEREKSEMQESVDSGKSADKATQVFESKDKRSRGSMHGSKHRGES
jgi:hypothetical protein